MRRPERFNFEMEEGKKYTEFVVSFFDILGFRSLIERGNANHIYNQINYFKYEHFRESQYIDAEDVEYYFFSDSVIRCFDLKTKIKSRVSVADKIITELQSINQMLFNINCWSDYFIRGGVQLGNAYSDGEIVFGPAVNEAYNIESSISDYPRVVVCDELSELLAENFLDAEILGNFMIDSFGVVMIDYLGPNLKYASEGSFYNHKNKIIEGFRSAKDEKVASKYRKLAAYHNDSIQNEPEYSDESFSNMIIKRQDMEIDDIRFHFVGGEYCEKIRNKMGIMSDERFPMNVYHNRRLFGAENRDVHLNPKIPTLIKHKPRSVELVCLHEAGHVLEMLRNGVVPTIVEVLDEGSEPMGRSRVQALSGLTKQNVAASGYAVELRLYRDGRLVNAEGNPVTEKQFIDEAVGQNASADKVRFFGENREQSNGCWPSADDRAFMMRGDVLSHALDMRFVEAFAAELLEKRKLDESAIRLLARQYGIYLASTQP